MKRLTVISLISICCLLIAACGEDEPGSEPVEDCAQVETAAQDPDSGECDEFATPCEVPSDWNVVPGGCEQTDGYDGCADVVTYGIDPDTGDCDEFSNPCEVPDGWKKSYYGCPESGDDDSAGTQSDDGDEACVQVIAYGTDPDTGECQQFPTPCDVPDGWDISYEGCPDDDDNNDSNNDSNNDNNNDDTFACSEDADCVVTGCSSHICAAESMDSTCEWKDEYACYDDPYTSCICNDGTCGWDETSELNECLDDADEDDDANDDDGNGDDDDANDDEACIQVITPAEDPETGECEEFPTPCDVPDGWETVDECPVDNGGGDDEMCIQVITPAEDPDTGECEEFPTPCDVPDGWETVDECPEDI